MQILMFKDLVCQVQRSLLIYIAAYAVGSPT